MALSRSIATQNRSVLSAGIFIEGFPDGSITASELRRECVRGRLVIERIAGKDYTTLENINQMRELCRVESNHHGSISGQQGGTRKEKSGRSRSGSSSIAASTSPQDALRAKIAQRSRHSQPTSPQSTVPPVKNKTSR